MNNQMKKVTKARKLFINLTPPHGTWVLSRIPRTALREFASRTISVDAGNVSMEMNACDMDTYLQSYIAIVDDYDNEEPVAIPENTCGAPEN